MDSVKINFTQEMWLLFTKSTQMSTQMSGWSENWTGWADPKILKGILVSDLGNKKKGEYEMPCLI